MWYPEDTHAFSSGLCCFAKAWSPEENGMIEYRMMNKIKEEQFSMLEGGTIYNQSPIVLVPSSNKYQNHTSGIEQNYYSILCTESNRNQSIKYNFQGYINEPNIVYYIKNQKYMYQAMELHLCTTRETMNEFPFLSSFLLQHSEDAATIHGAIVISHRSLTNAPKLYSCFFLTNQGQLSPDAEQIERLFDVHDSMKEMNQSEPNYVTMNDFIQDIPIISETTLNHTNLTVLFYKTPIVIRFPHLMNPTPTPRLLQDVANSSKGCSCNMQEGFGFGSPSIIEGMDNCKNTTNWMGNESCLECNGGYVLDGNIPAHCKELAGTTHNNNNSYNCENGKADITGAARCGECNSGYMLSGIPSRCVPNGIGSNNNNNSYQCENGQADLTGAARCGSCNDGYILSGAPSICVPNGSNIGAVGSGAIRKVTDNLKTGGSKIGGVKSSQAYDVFPNLVQNGNSKNYGQVASSCDKKAPANFDRSNIPKTPTTYSGRKISPVAGAKINSDATCKVFDEAMQTNLNNVLSKGPSDVENILRGIFDYRQNNDGLNPFIGGSGTNPETGGTGIDCYHEYVKNFWGNETNFTNYLIQSGVTAPPYYNYWNAELGPTTNYGFNPASIFYNLNGQCYDTTTVAFNIGRAEKYGINALADIKDAVFLDISSAANTAASSAQKAMDWLSGQGTNCSSTKGPTMTIEVPMIDDPEYTYQECSMIPGDETTVEPVYYTSQQQFFNMNNSLMGIVFYFIIFLMVYFGTPFMYYFMMCVVLKHGYNYTGTSTFGEYLRKPQSGIFGKSRGLSFIFNALYWVIVFIIYMVTFIPGTNLKQLNTLIILMIIFWVIGYIGVKNNPPPDSCMY